MQRDSARSAIGAYNRKPPPAQSWGSLRTGSFCHAHIRFTYRIVRDSGQTSFALLVGGAPFHIADPDAIEACHRVLQPTACAMGAWGPKVVYILASPADRSRHYLPQAPLAHAAYSRYTHFLAGDGSLFLSFIIEPRFVHMLRLALTSVLAVVHTTHKRSHQSY